MTALAVACWTAALAAEFLAGLHWPAAALVAAGMLFLYAAPDLPDAPDASDPPSADPPRRYRGDHRRTP